MATVAGTVLEFMKNYPEAVITAFGSTPSRTRLYQIAIQANLEDICQYLIIKGFKEGKWQDFEFHVNYEGFLVFNKK